MKFRYYRFFLNITRQIPLINPNSTREQALSQIFEKQTTFEHKKSTLGYVIHKSADGYVYASLGRKSSIYKVNPPDKEFQKEAIENWPNCSMFVNLSRDPQQGQTIAFEVKPSVFIEPLSQLRAFADKKNNELAHLGWELSINAITAEQDFWKIVDDNRGTIEELRLSFSAPNLFNSNDTLNEELKRAKEEFAITKAEMSLKNSDGNLRLSKDNKFLKESLDYITEGGGEYKITIRNRKVYRSGESVKSKAIDVSEVEIRGADGKMLEGLIQKVFECLEN